ncbi:MAG TPA: RNA pseudouridine synthase [Candidatus Limnocylindria bacterium]|nr:RNA pseudouridine synthase [Candidatus Limnocylindria bacterium]
MNRRAFGELQVLLEDERLIAVAKPAGQAVAPGGGVDAADTLQAAVAGHIGSQAFLVHRLDRETSGVIVFAKTAEAHRELSRQFEERLVTKRYLAIVQGHVEGRSGEIGAPLREFGSGRVGVDPKGRQAVTRWALRERLADADLLEVQPITGRRHQIRVHCYSIGHPILGDTRYGNPRPVGGAPRLMLHAAELVLADGVSVAAPPPADFDAVLEASR